MLNYEETRGNIWLKGGALLQDLPACIHLIYISVSCLPVTISLLLSFYSHLLTPMPSATAMFRHCMLWFTGRKGKVLYNCYVLLKLFYLQQKDEIL